VLAAAADVRAGNYSYQFGEMLWSEPSVRAGRGGRPVD